VNTKEYKRLYYLKNKENIKKRATQWYLENEKQAKLSRKKYYANNKDKFPLRTIDENRVYYLANIEKENERCRYWKNDNKVYSKEYQKEYRQSEHGRGVANFHTNKRRAAKLNATPKWLTKKQLNDIKNIYKTCPKGSEVHHIIPLQALSNVCGLHVPWNLEILTKEEHLSKHSLLNKKSFLLTL